MLNFLSVALEDYLRRAIKPFADRLAELERSIAAIPAGAKGDPQQIDVKLASLERRASRASDHLQKLEARVRKLEGLG